MFQIIRTLLFFTLVLGGIYPLVTFIFGKVLFSEKIAGSLIRVGEEVKGSYLISQKVESDDYFKARPSSGDYGTVASGASQFGYTNKKFYEQVMKGKESNLPIDAMTNSGSGLDPHISIEYAKYQVPAIAKKRQISEASLYQLIDNQREGLTMGMMGQVRVNVNILNQLLNK